MRLGKHQIKLLAFARKYPGWHTFSIDGCTERVVKRLENRNLITVNGFRQFGIGSSSQMLRVVNAMNPNPAITNL